MQRVQSCIKCTHIVFRSILVWYGITIFCWRVIIGCADITVQNNQAAIFGISLSFFCQRMHICVRCPARSKVQTNSHKYLWIFGRGDAKHRHRKARANTLFVIGRNIDRSVMDLRRFYLIISCPDNPLWSKTPSKVISEYMLLLNWKRSNVSIVSIDVSFL